MKQGRDRAGRPSIWLSDDVDDFDVCARRLASQFGEPIKHLEGLDQRYWDFAIDRATIAL